MARDTPCSCRIHEPGPRPRDTCHVGMNPASLAWPGYVHATQARRAATRTIGAQIHGASSDPTPVQHCLPFSQAVAAGSFRKALRLSHGSRISILQGCHRQATPLQYPAGMRHRTPAFHTQAGNPHGSGRLSQRSMGFHSSHGHPGWWSGMKVSSRNFPGKPRRLGPALSQGLAPHSLMDCPGGIGLQALKPGEQTQPGAEPRTSRRGAPAPPQDWTSPGQLRVDPQAGRLLVPEHKADRADAP